MKLLFFVSLSLISGFLLIFPAILWYKENFKDSATSLYLCFICFIVLYISIASIAREITKEEYGIKE